MITISILLIFFGCFSMYNTSKKVALQNNLFVEKWMHQNVITTKVVATALFILALVTSIYTLGTTSGVFFWLFCITTLLSLVIVLYPLQKVTYKHLALLTVLLFIIEYVIN